MTGTDRTDLARKGRRPRRFEGAIRIVSSWLVALVGCMAAWFVLTHRELSTTLVVFWYVVAAVAVVRAGYHTYRFSRGSREERSEG